MFISKEWQRASGTAGGEFWRISFLGEFPSLYLSANFQKCMNRETGRGENTSHDRWQLVEQQVPQSGWHQPLLAGSDLKLVQQMYWGLENMVLICGGERAGKRAGHDGWRVGEPRQCRGLVTPLFLLGGFPSEILLTICKAGRYRKHC